MSVNYNVVIEVIITIYFFQLIISVKYTKWRHDLRFRREIDKQKDETQPGTTVERK